MQIILKPNGKDKEMIEIWDEKGRSLYAVTHSDLFYRYGSSHDKGEIYSALKRGKILIVSLDIDRFVNKNDECNCQPYIMPATE